MLLTAGGRRAEGMADMACRGSTEAAAELEKTTPPLRVKLEEDAAAAASRARRRRESSLRNGKGTRQQSLTKRGTAGQLDGRAGRSPAEEELVVAAAAGQPPP